MLIFSSLLSFVYIYSAHHYRVTCCWQTLKYVEETEFNRMIVITILPIFSFFPHFEKIGGLWDHLAVFVPPPPISFFQCIPCLYVCVSPPNYSVFYVVRVVSMERSRLDLCRTFSYIYHNFVLLKLTFFLTYFCVLQPKSYPQHSNVKLWNWFHLNK
jgi:hypothetical protein